ncbi:MAG: sensor domain-containing diguanylate cyclase, partial [Candidatus Omnitrophica bacterium]|nr:sensor domain-containing diguanylate cyclase [Candidatus Omnitrophota bacterium]
PKEELFNRIISSNEPLVIDKQNALPENLMAGFREKFKLTNTLALPVYLKGRVVAIMGIGNSKASFLYKKDDMELLDIFTKQIAIAVENDILTRRVEKLEIKDALTGLYNEVFIHDRLQEEIKRAIIYRRPCAFILIDIDNFKTYHQNYGLLHAESALKKIASLIRDSVSDVDKVGRTGDDEFAIIVPERNKRQAQQIAEQIRERIEFTFSEEQNADKKITASGGVSENPLDGVDAQELAAKAKELLGVAKKQGKNRIVGFKETPVCQ